MNLIKDDALVLAATVDTCFMVYLVCLLAKTHLLALLQDNCLGLLCFLEQVFWMREEYYNIASTPTEAD